MTSGEDEGAFSMDLGRRAEGLTTFRQVFADGRLYDFVCSSPNAPEDKECSGGWYDSVKGEHGYWTIKPISPLAA